MSFFDFAKIYDRKALLRYLVLFALIVAAGKYSNGLALFLYVPIAVVLITSNRTVGLFFCVLSIISFMIGNPYLFPKTRLGFIALRLTLAFLAFAMTIRAMGRKNSPYVRPLLGILPYILFMTLSSCQGWSPIISLLKIFLFTFIYLALYSVANDTIQSQRTDESGIRSAVLSIPCVFIIGSLLLKPFPGISMMNIWNATPEQLATLPSLYMGMTNQSQCLGPVVGSISTLVLGDFLFSNRKFDPLYVVILLISPILIYWTSSRTAMGTYLIGQAIMFYFFINDRRILRRWRAKVFSVVMPLMIVLLTIAMCIPSVQGRVWGFVLKRTGDATASQVTMDDFTSSRRGLAERAMENFRKKPMLGNGFQVSASMEGQNREGLFEYLSAPIEKGYWVAAVLEEGGAIGFTLFSGFLLVSFISLKRRKAYITAGMIVVVTASNLGEFTFFSMSYAGGMHWAMVFAAAVMDATRLNRYSHEAQLKAFNGEDSFEDYTGLDVYVESRTRA